MSSALLAGVSGLIRSHEMLDVAGNSLANHNTTGFKEQTPLFSDLLSQTLVPASAANIGSAANPIQVSFGSQTFTVETNYTQGALNTTGNPLDAAIQGQAFFVANNGPQDLYARAGAFSIDAAGCLADPATGYLNRVRRRRGATTSPKGERCRCRAASFRHGRANAGWPSRWPTGRPRAAIALDAVSGSPPIDPVCGSCRACA